MAQFTVEAFYFKMNPLSFLARSTFFRFCLIGLLSFTIYNILYIVCFVRFEKSAVASITVAYIASAIAHFYLNKNFSFKLHKKFTTNMLLKYVFVICLTYGVIYGLTHVFERQQFNLLLLPVASTFVSVILSFFLLKCLVFQKTEE